MYGHATPEKKDRRFFIDDRCVQEIPFSFSVNHFNTISTFRQRFFSFSDILWLFAHKPRVVFVYFDVGCYVFHKDCFRFLALSSEKGRIFITGKTKTGRSPRMGNARCRVRKRVRNFTEDTTRFSVFLHQKSAHTAPRGSRSAPRIRTSFHCRATSRPPDNSRSC